nr:Unknown Function [uncultured bacterium]
MAKRKIPAAAKPRAVKASKKVGLPDTSVLARYSPTDGPGSHPDWIKQRFPTYVDPHAGHQTSSVREFTYAGHVGRIITTYRIEVDGQEVHPHLSVDEDGRVFTHALPFVTYASAVDLMKDVIGAYSDDFFRTDNGSHDHGGGHDHGGEHEHDHGSEH